MKTHDSILVVEDNEDDIFLMRRALKNAHIVNPLVVLEDGLEALNYLAGAGMYADREKYPMPAIVFLDLKLPIKDGFEVLKWIRANPSLDSLIVVVLTSSNEPSDVKTAYGLGANSYLVKPPTVAQLLDMAKSFKWYWLQFNEFAPAGPASAAVV